MSSQRTFEVKALTRVEGEGRLYVKLDGKRVERVELNIYEPPRFFEALLRGRGIHEVPDITARICGICPVAYQMSSCHALENALGISVSPEICALRTMLYCGEWIESHSLHVHMLHAPDFLGYESAISMAADLPEVVERGLRIKKAGNQILEVLGGRAIHPINVTVGGFYRAPSPDKVRELIPALEQGLTDAVASLQFVSQLDFPEFPVPYECVSLRSPAEYPMNHGRIAMSSGTESGITEIEINEYEQHFQEQQVAHSTALHSLRLPQQTPYLVGPLARVNLCREQLAPVAAREAAACGIAWPSNNNFHSIVARMIEVVHAFEKAIEIASAYEQELSPVRVEYTPQAGAGCHATEAPRGLLYHRYEIGDDGLISAATIVPPTSQNQAQIESDLRAQIPSVLELDDQAATHRLEHLIRNYDPCISCATHFLQIDWESSPGE